MTAAPNDPKLPWPWSLPKTFRLALGYILPSDFGGSAEDDSTAVMVMGVLVLIIGTTALAWWLS